MATGTHYGDKTTIAMAPTPSTVMDAFWKGKLRVCVDKITTIIATMDIGSTISMGLIPKGAYVLGFFVVHGAVAGAMTANIGDGTTAARFGAITSMNAAGKQIIPSSDPHTALTADTYIVLTTAGSNVIAAVDIYVMTFYVAP